MNRSIVRTARLRGYLFISFIVILSVAAFSQASFAGDQDGLGGHQFKVEGDGGGGGEDHAGVGPGGDSPSSRAGHDADRMLDVPAVQEQQRVVLFQLCRLMLIIRFR